MRYLDDSQLQIGKVRDNKLHGLGKVVFRDGRVCDGVFIIDDEFCDQVGDKYEGEMFE